MTLTKESALLRVGILGCGPISQFAHLDSVQKGRNVLLAAVCDHDAGLARTFGGFYGAERIYTDYDEMLADDSIDAIIVATADAFHVPASQKALRAGRHVFCEKPVGISVEEVEELAADVAASGMVFQIGHMLRYDAGIQSAHDFIRDEMGEMIALKAWYCDSTHRYTNTDALQPLPRRGSNAMKPEGDPKADRQRYFLLAHGSHVVDLARYLAGPIRSVRARHLERAGAHCWFVDVDFETGALGHLDLTIPVRMDWHEGFEVYGENGSAVARILNPWFYRTSEVDIFREAEGGSSRILGADGHFYRRQIEGFADTILNGAPMGGATIADGVASVRAMVAIGQSVRTGKPVDLSKVSGAV